MRTSITTTYKIIHSQASQTQQSKKKLFHTLLKRKSMFWVAKTPQEKHTSLSTNFPMISKASSTSSSKTRLTKALQIHNKYQTDDKKLKNGHLNDDVTNTIQKTHILLP